MVLHSWQGARARPQWAGLKRSCIDLHLCSGNAAVLTLLKVPNSVDVSDIFKIVSARGRERGSPRRQEGEGQFLIENLRRGGSSRRWKGGGRAGRCLRGIGGGGWLDFFFGGAEIPTKLILPEEQPGFVYIARLVEA